MKLWVDDIVKAPEGWAWCRSVGGAKTFIETYEKKDDGRDPLTIINVDTDAGCWKSEGGDYIELLKWLEATGRNYRVKIHMKDYPDSYGMFEEMQEIIRRNRWDDMDTYLVINGKKVELTEEQLKALGIVTKKNPFERVAKSEPYYYIDAFDCIQTCADNGEDVDNASFEVSNYFNDKATAQQVRLHQLLYRKLLKFAYDNECEDNQTWNKVNCHYYIGYNINEDRFYVDVTVAFKHNDVWFCSRDSANRAIEEIIKPFMKEHPEFVW